MSRVAWQPPQPVRDLIADTFLDDEDDVFQWLDIETSQQAAERLLYLAERLQAISLKLSIAASLIDP